MILSEDHLATVAAILTAGMLTPCEPVQDGDVTKAVAAYGRVLDALQKAQGKRTGHEVVADAAKAVR